MACLITIVKHLFLFKKIKYKNKKAYWVGFLGKGFVNLHPL